MSSNIDKLIINSPFEMPISHWKYDREKRKFARVDGRRSAGYLVASKDSQVYDDPGEFRELELVNKIRVRVDLWRDNNYHGITGITKRLLEHWKNPNIRDNKFFFCQLEAIEILIWWVEAPPNEKQGIVLPSDGGLFERVCCKMATGTGKTIVMGMLFAWQVLNKVTYPQDTRFSKNVLVMAPGLTVKKRLEVLYPSSEKNIYSQFQIVPDNLLDKLRQGKILVHNWHALMPLEEPKKSVMKKGPESDEVFTKRILGEMSQSKNLIVINDEAHHAWRVNPNLDVKIDKDELEEATKWIEGLDRIHSTRNILRCFDFSATPFVPSGKNVNEESLFGWIVSDFSLNDAIESGLVKTPRIAVRDDSGRFDKQYRSRFYHIYRDDDVKPDLNRNAKPEEPLPDLVKNAYVLLGQDWLVTKQEWDSSKSPIPPVMITVCNRTETAARVFESFKQNAFNLEQLGEPDKILHIDSKVLKQAENEELRKATKPSKSKKSKEPESEDDEESEPEKISAKDFGEHLRETVDTVGKIGKPGQYIRNIIAVSMLSEGWDATNVTHIMGLRAFTSQLLCEQVVGRGLRRTSYDINEDGLFDPEYVNIFGVPFTFLPHEGGDGSPPAPTLAQTRIEPDQEKIQYEISWPNIDRIERIFPQKITLDINEAKPIQLKSNDYSLTVDMTGVISGKPVLETMSELDLIKLNAKIRIQWIIFQAAKQILPEIKQDWKGSPEALMMQIVKIVEDFISSDKITVSNVDESEEIKRKLIIAFNLTKIVKHIVGEIKISNTQERRLVLNKEKPLKSTGDMQPWYTRKPNDPTQKSHINFAVHDSRWEASATQELERNSQIEAWVKNDHLGFKILYVYNGILHEYWPDYLVRLKNGVTLVLEIKGEDSEQNKAKRESLKEWIEAVNEDGKYGSWSWDVAFDPADVRSILKKHNETIPTISYISKCPACGKTAASLQDIDKLFGFRNMNGFIRSQSWCRDCRKNQA
jgi:type III restriction enzyme